MARHPVLQGRAWAIVKRIEATDASADEYPASLPSPTQPDVLYAVRTRPATVIEAVLRAVSDELKTYLDTATFEKYLALEQRLTQDIRNESQVKKRMATFDTFERKLETDIDRASLEQYLKIRNSAFATLMLGKWNPNESR
jgi:hypothetical protein